MLNPDLYAQGKVYKKLSAFIPGGYSILDTSSGNLDLDKYTDLVLILKSTLEHINEDTTRPLLLLSGNGKGLYTLIARNDSVVLCKGCEGIFGDPYEGITIKNGFFSIEHYGGSGWRWTRIITFKMDKKNHRFLLHKDSGISYHTTDPEKRTIITSNPEDYNKLDFVNFSYLK